MQDIDTIRYENNEMLFERALESQHESALSTARNRQLKSVKTEKLKVENMLRNNSKQSGESVESVLEKNRKATVGRISDMVNDPEYTTGLYQREAQTLWTVTSSSGCYI